MVQAYSYRIESTHNCYWVYLNEILLGTLDKGTRNTWHVNIEISGDQFLFSKSGFLKSSINILDINSGESIGRITIPLIPFFFQKFKFVYKGGKKMVWVGKNFFSFHWLWKINKKTVVETIEDIVEGNKSGVITLSSYLTESNLLILIGVFLSLRRKNKLSFGLYNLNRRGLDHAWIPVNK
jgi:hypothetical protein